MQVDYVKLHERVRSLMSQKLEPREAPPYSAVMDILEGVMRAEKVRVDLVGKDVKFIGGCESCLNLKALNKAKVLGSGFFGVVFDIGKGLAMKVEIVEDAAAVTDGIPIAAKAGTARIGPKVHAWKVCDCGQAAYLVTVMDKIKGMTLMEWIRKTSSKKGAASKATSAAVRKALDAKIKRMAKIGIKHNDLHPGNIMVDTKNEPWIIDFTYQAGARDDNGRILEMFDRVGPAQVNEIGAIYDALVKEGTISVVGNFELPRYFMRK